MTDDDKDLPTPETDALEKQPEVEADETAVPPQAEAQPHDEAADFTPERARAWYAEMKRERERRQKLEQQVGTMEARFQDLAQMVRQPPEPKPEPEPEKPPVSYEENPAEYLKWQNERLAKQQAEMTEWRNQEALQAREAQAQQQLHIAASAVEAEFVAEHPDYYDALGYLRQQLAADFQARYAWAPPAAIQQELVKMEAGLVRDALQARRNPAEIVYAWAKNRGYHGKAASADPQPPQQQRTPSPERQAATKSLSNAAGVASGTPSLAEIASWPQAKYDAWREKNGQSFKELMGG